MIARLYGDFGAARFLRHLSVVYLNESTNVCIVRCLREDKDLLQSAASFINKFVDEPCQSSMQTIHVAGSIKQCKKYLVKYSVEQLLQLNAKINETNRHRSEALFKTRKVNVEQKNSSNLTDEQKEKIFRRLLNDCRDQSSSNIEMKSEPSTD